MARAYNNDGHSKIGPDGVKQIRYLAAKGWPRAEIARRFSIHVDSVTRIVNRRTRADVA